MAKYKYNKSALKGLGVGAFLGEVKTRNAQIEAAPDNMPVSIFNANRLAADLHPYAQHCKVSKIINHQNAKSYILVPDEAKGTNTLAYFRAGQYVSVDLEIHGAILSKPYSLCSRPKAALGKTNNSYTLTIQYNPKGFASAYIPTHWEVGTSLTISAPLGDFYYQSLRDAKNVIALAGGSGITPFISMASAIADGIEDFNLTILYGSRTKDSILLKDELDAIVARANGKVKIVHVLSDESSEGFEHGFITSDLIKKYAPEDDYSIFVCGPKAMYRFLESELAKLNLPHRRVRFELSGEYGDPTHDTAYPADKSGAQYSITVWIHGKSQIVKCPSEQSLLQAMEAAGIRVPSNCRSGECGWCHSRLISGNVYIPEGADGRREADKKFGWIHPCSTYPLSDIALEVFPVCKA